MDVKKTGNSFGAVAVCIGGMILAWYGVHGNVFMFNLYKFLTCLALVMDSLNAIARSQLKPEQRTRSKVVAAVATLTDFLIVFLMAGYGHFVFAVIQFLQVPVEGYIFSKGE